MTSVAASLHIEVTYLSLTLQIIPLRAFLQLRQPIIEDGQVLDADLLRLPRSSFRPPPPYTVQDRAEPSTRKVFVPDIVDLGHILCRAGKRNGRMAGKGRSWWGGRDDGPSKV